MEKIINVITAVFVTVFIICASVSIVLNANFLYYCDIELLNIPETSGMSVEKIKENYNAVIQYMSVFEEGELVFPSLPMSETGKIHFREVKNIFSAFWYVGLFSLIASVLLIAFGGKNLRFLRAAGWLSTGTSVFAVLFVVFLGEQAFIAFHKIFFNNNYWIFDERFDPVIKILPEAFFFHCGAAIVLLTAISGIIMLFINNSLTKK